MPAYSENPTFLKELINYYRETGETDKLMDELEHYLRLVPTDTEMQDLYETGNVNAFSRSLRFLSLFSSNLICYNQL